MLQHRLKRVVLMLLLGGAFAVGCSGNKAKSSHRVAVLSSQSDSLAYIVGMNIGEQLLKMDTTLNMSVVCRAIIERVEGGAIMSDEDARTSYLRYLLFVEPERRRVYEEKYLSDLAETNRSFTRTKTGLTYNISKIGDEKVIARSANDWLTLRYSISRVGGDVIVADSLQSMALADLVAGVSEGIKLIGKGGKIDAWIPSKLAYGEAGDESLGVEPIETLFYQIEFVDIEKGVAVSRKKDLEVF